MDAFLLHCLALAWASAGSARRLACGFAERLLVTALLAWANIVATSLLLSAAQRLGSPGWFFATSLGLAVGLGAAASRLTPEPADQSPAMAPGGRAVTVGRWVLLTIMLLSPLLLGRAGLSHAALAHELPRVLYYLGQNSLAPFAAGDPRQLWLPFNSELLLFSAAVYDVPLPVVGAAAASLPIWAAAASLCVPLFILRWTRTRLARHALLAGVAAGLAAGSELGLLLLVATAGAFAGLVALVRSRRIARVWFGAALLAALLALPFAVINFHATGRLASVGTPLPWFASNPWAPPAAPGPALPALIPHRLVPQTRINIDTDATDEEIFPLMSLAPGQRFTARRQAEADAYQLFSRDRSSRDAVSARPGGPASCTLVPIPAKRTAGVEFLGTLGRGRDYFGLEPHAGAHAPIDSNRNALLTIAPLPAPAGGVARVRLRVAGLNPGDGLRLAVSADYTDWSSAPLATFESDGESDVLIARPLRWLTVRVLEGKSGDLLPLDPVELPAVITTGHGPVPVALQPAGASSLFVTELVVRRHNSGLIAATGLLPTEGPHGYLYLPYVRWAVEPVVRLTVPATPGLARVQLAFSVRPQSREHVEFDVRLNGRPTAHYQIDGRERWLDRTLDLALPPGENLIEFADVTRKTGPDWLDYLARYPDVKAYVDANHIPPEQGASEHFAQHGRAEGRTVQPFPAGTPAVPPESRYFLFRQLRLEGFKNP